MAYKELQEGVPKTVLERTGCLAPCSYKEYRISDSNDIVGKSYSFKYLNVLSVEGLWGLWTVAVEHFPLHPGGD